MNVTESADRQAGVATHPHERLRALGLELPAVSPPKGAYVPAVRSGRLILVAGQIPLVDGELPVTGTVGHDLDEETARELSARCALSALAAVRQVAALEAVTVVKVVGWVACAPGFTAVDRVVDGASELLTAVLGEAGRHARSTVGVARLPLNSPVEIEITAALRD